METIGTTSGLPVYHTNTWRQTDKKDKQIKHSNSPF
jgi:hypothetical protein